MAALGIVGHFDSIFPKSIDHGIVQPVPCRKDFTHLRSHITLQAEFCSRVPQQMTLRISSCVQLCCHMEQISLGMQFACRCKAKPSLTQEGKLPPAMKKLEMKCSMSRGIWHGCCHVSSDACLYMQMQWVPLVIQRVNLLKRLCSKSRVRKTVGAFWKEQFAPPTKDFQAVRHADADLTLASSDPEVSLRACQAL